MKLEVGKYYKTRDGKKAVISSKHEHPTSYPYVGIVGDNYSTSWTENGYLISKNSECKNDLISEWQEEIKFKNGDKVCCLKKEYGNETVGKIYTVSSMHSSLPNWFRVIEDDDGFPNCYECCNFELVINEETELKDLIDIANKGEEAAIKIYQKYINKVDRVTKVESNYTYHTWSLKNEKKFRSFITKEGWVVKIENDKLHIGCESFSLDKAKSYLKHLCKENRIFAGYDNEYYVKRSGIGKKGDGKNILSWEDADTILKQLEEMDNK